MSTLRSAHGCPWDRKQTHGSLRRYLLEETYEAVDAIDRGDLDELRGELGDVLLQVVFHAQIAGESGRFDLADVADAVIAKLVVRHPHVFTASGRPLTPAAHRRLQLESAEAVREQWAAIKAREQTATGADRRVLAGVPRALPALLRAHTIGSRVASVGFDWPSAAGVVDKIEEEVRELRAATTQGRAQTVDELGDLLFAIANLARKLGVDSESALSEANDKFTRRFNALEALLQSRGRDVHSSSFDELEAAWAAVKARESRPRPAPAKPRRSKSAVATRARRSRR